MGHVFVYQKGRSSMAIDDYHNLSPQERLERIARLINKGIYLYYHKTNGKIEEPSQEKEIVSVSKIQHKESMNVERKDYHDEKILTVNEAIEFLKISRTTLWRLKRQREISYCIVSRRLIRFKLSEILNYLERKTKRFTVRQKDVK